MAASKHEIRPLTLPDRFWKWRMHGGAVTLARRFMEEPWQPDLILATDMLDLSTFAALTKDRTAALPLILYMHENQLTYPLPADKRIGAMRRQLGERDQHYAFINYVSMLTADHICFNSTFHYESFFEALTPFLKHFPEYNELHSITQIKAKSTILSVGINFARLDGVELKKDDALPPLIFWNQRWEYDKNPEAFFEALFRLKEMNVPFRLAVCGQQFGKRPSIFEQAAERLSDSIIHFGYADETTYRQLCWQADLVVSTAHHEFFGISLLEAAGCYTLPLLPNRLSYPTIFDIHHFPELFYEDQSGLVERLVWALNSPGERQIFAEKVSKFVQKYSWQNVVDEYDTLFEAAGT